MVERTARLGTEHRGAATPDEDAFRRLATGADGLWRWIGPVRAACRRRVDGLGRSAGAVAGVHRDHTGRQDVRRDVTVGQTRSVVVLGALVSDLPPAGSRRADSGRTLRRPGVVP